MTGRHREGCLDRTDWEGKTQGLYKVQRKVPSADSRQQTKKAILLSWEAGGEGSIGLNCFLPAPISSGQSLFALFLYLLLLQLCTR